MPDIVAPKPGTGPDYAKMLDNIMAKIKGGAPPEVALTQVVDDETAQAQQYFEKNKPYVKAGDNVYNTALSPEEEVRFRQWVAANNVPFDVSAKVSDYDMRGFWKALQTGDSRAATAVNPNDKQIHYPDFWKTPYDASFSAESQWANPVTAPRWNDKDQLVLPNGKVIYDERAVVRAGGKTG